MFSSWYNSLSWHVVMISKQNLICLNNLFYKMSPLHFLSLHSSLLPLTLSAFLLQTPPLPPCWMNDSASVSLSVSVIDQTPAAAVTSWKDKPCSEKQYFYWSSPWPTGLDSSREWKSRSSHLLSWEPERSWCGGWVDIKACIDDLIDGKSLAETISV